MFPPEFYILFNQQMLFVRDRSQHRMNRRKKAHAFISFLFLKIFCSLWTENVCLCIPFFIVNLSSTLIIQGVNHQNKTACLIWMALRHIIIICFQALKIQLYASMARPQVKCACAMCMCICNPYNTIQSESLSINCGVLASFYRVHRGSVFVCACRFFQTKRSVHFGIRFFYLTSTLLIWHENRTHVFSLAYIHPEYYNLNSFDSRQLSRDANVVEFIVIYFFIVYCSCCCCFGYGVHDIAVLLFFTLCHG